MRNFSRAVWGTLLCVALVAVSNGCGKPKEPPPGAPNDKNAAPTIDLGGDAGLNEGAGMEPLRPGAGQESRKPGISGEGQAPEEPAPSNK